MEEKNGAQVIAHINEKGYAALVPAGNSMWPTLKNRGQSVIIGKKQGKLKRFDVVFYARKNGDLVLHRIMEVKDDGYVCQGDSQFFFENVAENQVFGVMLGFYHGKKYVSCQDEKYKKQVEKLFSDEKKRQRRVKRHFFFINIKSLPIRAFNKIFRKNKGK